MDYQVLIPGKANGSLMHFLHMRGPDVGYATACVAMVLATATGCSGTTSGTKGRTNAKPSSRAAASATSEPSPTRLQIPSTQPGEIARLTYSGTAGSVIARTEHSPARDTSYVLRGQCLATAPGKSITYQVTAAADPAKLLAGGGIVCGGDVTVDTAVLATHEPVAVQVSLVGPLDGITEVYAVIVPSPGQKVS